AEESVHMREIGAENVESEHRRYRDSQGRQPLRGNRLIPPARPAQGPRQPGAQADNDRLALFRVDQGGRFIHGRVSKRLATRSYTSTRGTSGAYSVCGRQRATGLSSGPSHVHGRGPGGGGTR